MVERQLPKLNVAGSIPVSRSIHSTPQGASAVEESEAMSGTFVSSTEVKRDDLDWGSLAWFSSPEASNAKDLVVIEVTFKPGSGHSFHLHPNQEESLYVIEGQIEQWVDQEKRLLGPGDSAFVGAGTVHASFNVGDGNAKLLAILGPCVGPEGYELVDVADQDPWASLRA